MERVSFGINAESVVQPLSGWLKEAASRNLDLLAVDDISYLQTDPSSRAAG